MEKMRGFLRWCLLNNLLIIINNSLDLILINFPKATGKSVRHA